MSVSFNPNSSSVLQAETPKSNEPKTSLFKIPSIKKLILGAFAIQGAAMAPRVEAGPLAYVLCMAGCTAGAAANPALVPLLPSCYMICAGVAAVPTP